MAKRKKPNLVIEDLDYHDLESIVIQIFSQAGMTFVPALLIEAMRACKERGNIFQEDGMSRIAKRIEMEG